MSKKDKKNSVPQENEEVRVLQAELEEAKGKYLRALADYHNLEKRIQVSGEEAAKQATRKMVLRLLPFLDNLEKAEVFISDQGLKMIKDQFEKTLEAEGIEELDVLGKEFDPEEAEAIDTVPGEEDNIVAEVVHRGYSLYGKVIRPAQVKVTKKES